MNGIHDMGGMHGMGPIAHENNEPVFHSPWERRVFALTLAMLAWPGWTNFRFGVEQIPPADYLRMSYYEKWLVRLVDRVVKSGFVTRTEMERGRPDPDRPKPPLP